MLELAHERRMSAILHELMQPLLCRRPAIQVSTHGWENHVLANHPFYASLLPMFVDLLRSRISTRGDGALRHFCKVCPVLNAVTKFSKPTLLDQPVSDTQAFTTVLADNRSPKSVSSLRPRRLRVPLVVRV